MTDLTGSKDALTLAGDGVKRALSGIDNKFGPRLFRQVSASPDAQDLARLVAAEAVSGRSPAPPNPFYLRPPDVRRPPATQRQAES